MIKKFNKFIQQNKLLNTEKTTLLAVSGGVDSMVMIDLFQKANLPFAIATCDFQLRGAEAKKDVLLVEETAKKHEISFYKIAFNTKRIAKEKGWSIQVAARELRYEWLENIRQNNDYQYIATAHHLNDSIETVVYNLAKGCGIRGFHGILPINKKIIRPLLFATKAEILAYAKAKKIVFREDASNAVDKYARNYIRHQIVPRLKTLNPSVEQTFGQNIQRFRETEKLFNFAVEQIKSAVFKQEKNQFFIDIEQLKTFPAPATLLFEWLSPFGFNADHVSQIIRCFAGETGKQFFSSTHQIVINRGQIIGQPIQKKELKNYVILENQDYLRLPNGSISIEKIMEKALKFPDGKNTIVVDAENLTFPLTVRHWQKGDVFQPFGMGGKRKKLSDFFTDLKLSRLEKEKVWIVESSKKIVWIVGYRMDERFRIHLKKGKILRFHFVIE